MNPAKMIDNGRFLYRESQKPKFIKAGMEWPQNKSLKKAFRTYGKHVPKGSMVRQNQTIIG